MDVPVSYIPLMFSPLLPIELIRSNFLLTGWLAGWLAAQSSSLPVKYESRVGSPAWLRD